MSNPWNKFGIRVEKKKGESHIERTLNVDYFCLHLTLSMWFNVDYFCLYIIFSMWLQLILCSMVFVISQWHCHL